MKQIYKSELEAMQDFWEELNITPDYTCNTDGVVDGLLFEMKLEIKSYAVIEPQLIRYIRAYNSTAMPIPSRAVVININRRLYSLYKIRTTAEGKISLHLTKSGVWCVPIDFKELINESLHSYSKGWVDEYSIVSYNNRYCNNHKKACKEQVKEELINPTELNIYPFNWEEQIAIEKADRGSNNWLTFNMDMLGCSLLKKQLGAFFTPDEYVRISTEYIKDCIEQIEAEGFDYIIIDTCAGTGNLQKFFKRVWLERTILNTYDYTEWTTLKGIYEGRVKMIVPHTSQYRNQQGLLLDGDALSEDFNKYITNWIANNIDRNKTKIIMIENPPFAEPSGIRGKNFKTKHLYTYKIMGEAIKKTIKNRKKNKNINRDLANMFIWQAFNVIRCDYYIVYSPIKYWKSQEICDKKFIKGYCCNRGYFNASESCVALILWKNINETKDKITLDNDLDEKTIIHKQYNNIIDLQKDSKEYTSIAFFINSGNMPRYMSAHLFNDKSLHKSILRTQKGYKLSYDNIFTQLPLWVANYYKYKNYTEIDVIMKSSDGGDEYIKDKDFMNKCFIWSCLSENSQCVSNQEVINELCLGQGTIADDILATIILDEDDKELIVLWNKLLIKVKEKEEYNSDYKYNLRQICKEINILIDTGRKKKNGEPDKDRKYYEIGDVDYLVKQLKSKLRAYYEKHLTPKLFKYKLLV